MFFLKGLHSRDFILRKQFNQITRSLPPVEYLSRSYRTFPLNLPEQFYCDSTRFQPSSVEDLQHLNQMGRIRQEILNQRSLFLRQEGLLQNELYFQDHKVYANLHLFSLTQKDLLGRTNLERMESGFCPINLKGDDLIVIHHFDQTHKGPWVVLEESFHKKEHHNLHSELSLKEGVNRKYFKEERRAFWKFVAKHYDKLLQIGHEHFVKDFQRNSKKW